MELNDKQLAVRWWSRRTTQEIQLLISKYLGGNESINLSDDDKYWIWRKNQTL